MSIKSPAAPTETHTELVALRELAAAVAKQGGDFDEIEALYAGPAMGLIDRIITRIENELCEMLGMKRFDPYEGDGGLADGIACNLHNLLVAAGAIDGDTGELPGEQINSLRQLLGEAHTRLMAAGWREDDFVARVKAAAATARDETNRVLQLAAKIAALEEELGETRRELALKCQELREARNFSP